MEHQNRYASGKATSGPASYTATPWISQSITSNGVASRPPALGGDGVGYLSKWVETKIYKFNWRTGAILGQYQPPAPQFCVSSPALVSDANVVAGDNGGGQGKIFSINTATLFHNWVKVIGSIASNDADCMSPIVGPDGSVLACDGSGNAYRWNSATGAEIWKRSGLSSTTRSPAMTRDDAGVIVSHGGFVSRLRFSDGVVEWTKNMGSATGAPCVTESGKIAVGTDSGFVFCLDPTTGATIWSYQTFAAVRSAPATDGDSLYVCSNDQYLYKIRISDGIAPWGVSTSSSNWSSPVVGHDGRIYFTNRVGDSYCISPEGSVIWKVSLGGEVRGSTAIGPDGTLYVPTATSLGLVFLRQSPAHITGRVRLPDMDPNSYQFPLPMTVRLTARNSTTVVATSTTTVANDETFAIDILPPFTTTGSTITGQFDATLQVKHCLRKKVQLDLADGMDDATDITPLCGDIDGDNNVTVFDYSILSKYWDRNMDQSGWTTKGSDGFAPVDADLDGDGTVSVFDYAILSSNFGKKGD